MLLPLTGFCQPHRRASEDAQLAKLLVDELRAAGHEVFIDVDMPIGVDWSAEITRRIRWCDYLVVLLSADSIDSEMVQGEVRLAHQNRREDGSPFIFPVRVRYEGRLDYELDAYLGRLQYLMWKRREDGSAIVAAILNAAQAGVGPGEAQSVVSEGVAPETDQRRPRPAPLRERRQACL